MDEQQTPIPAELLQFLRSKVNSFIKWDLVRFFHDNPHAIDSAPNIARYTLRDERIVRRQLDELVQNGIVASEMQGEVQVYRLTSDESQRDLLRRFIAACDDRAFRVRAINEVIHEMQFSPRHDF
jgi:DNA-binding transcriptional ArsR family regulator